MGCGDQRSKPVLWPGKREWRPNTSCLGKESPLQKGVYSICVCVWVCVGVDPAAVGLTQIRCAAGGSIPQALFIRHLQRGAPLPVVIIVRAALGHLGGIHSPRVEGHLGWVGGGIQTGLSQHLWFKGGFALHVRAFKRSF